MLNYKSDIYLSVMTVLSKNLYISGEILVSNTKLPVFFTFKQHGEQFDITNEVWEEKKKPPLFW